MSATWLISDTHFGHKGVTVFTDKEGKKIRPWTDVEEMDEALVDNWNKVVKPKDRIYHLGDVVINRKALKILDRLAGRKVLVKGNHDLFKIGDYLEYFDDIRGSHILDNFILTHIPVHPNQIARWAHGNIHGHLHTNVVTLEDGTPDKRYINVSVEQINFTPINFEEIRKTVKIEVPNPD